MATQKKARTKAEMEKAVLEAKKVGAAKNAVRKDRVLRVGQDARLAIARHTGV